MKKILAAVLCASLFVSCQKEVSFETGLNNPGAGGSLPGGIEVEGVWQFVESRMDAITEVSTSAGGQTFRSTTESKYTTTNNTGTIEFTGNTMKMRNLGYSISYDAVLTTYIDGLALSTDNVPFAFDAPAQDGDQPYKKISADSILMQATGTSTPFGQNTPTSPTSISQEFGGKFSYDNGLLYLRINIEYEREIDNGQGIPAKMKAKGFSTMVMKK